MISGKPQLAKGNHRLFIGSVLGSRYDQMEQCYVFSEPANVAVTIRAITDYLAENHVDYELDSKANRLLTHMIDDEKLLAISKRKGSQIRKGRFNAFRVPGFVRALKDYQRVSVKHMVEIPYDANFSVPGSGKTTIVFAAYAMLRKKHEVDKLFVIGPRSSFRPWEEEFSACFGRDPTSIRIVGAREKRLRRIRTATGVDLYLATYPMVANEASEIRDLLSSANFMLVLDESHNIKKFEGGVWSQIIMDLAQYAKRRVILTGTPAPNSIFDLWTQFTFLWPNRTLLGERESFKAKSDTVGSHSELARQLRPLFCRIRKSDLHLPQPIFEIVKVDLEPVQKSIYDALSTRVLAEITNSPEEREELRTWKKRKMIRLLQTASNPALLTHFSDEFLLEPFDASGLPIVKLLNNYSDYEIPAKFVAAEALARKSIENGDKVIVWTWFIHNIKMLSKRLSDQNPLEIYGEVPNEEERDSDTRETRIEEFKNSARPRVLLANPSATAESISLHKVCHTAIYMDRTFNCGQYLQSLDRIHRVGLGPHDKTKYKIILANNTIDEVVNVRLNLKMQRMGRLLDDELPVLNLDQDTDEVTGSDTELNQDFDAVLKHLRKHQMRTRHD